MVGGGCGRYSPPHVCYVVEISPLGVGESPQTEVSAEARKKKNIERLTTRGSSNDIAHDSCIRVLTVLAPRISPETTGATILHSTQLFQMPAP